MTTTIFMHKYLSFFSCRLNIREEDGGRVSPEVIHSEGPRAWLPPRGKHDCPQTLIPNRLKSGLTMTIFSCKEFPWLTLRTRFVIPLLLDIYIEIQNIFLFLLAMTFPNIIS